MPHRDYASRRSAKGGSKLWVLILIILILLASAVGIWYLSQMKNAQAQNKMSKQETPTKAKTSLPSRPEEHYSYIRDLETREVPIDPNSKFAQLTKEQEQQILKKQAEKQKLAEQANLAAQPVLDEATKQAEIRKQQALDQKIESLTKAQQTPTQAVSSTTHSAENKTPPQATPVKTAETAKTTGQYGLQCGAFKNKAQAENMQARLAMAGFDARVNSSADWNRVVVGPIGNRAAAVSAQGNAKSVADCLVVSM